MRIKKPKPPKVPITATISEWKSTGRNQKLEEFLYDEGVRVN